MANPQIENGHVDIANEIFEALARTRIPGEARQVMDFILRKTYGWHKKQDQISLSQFVEGTGLNKPHVCQAINHLVKMNLITKKGNAQSLFTKKGNDDFVIYGFQKDFEKWASLPKKVTLPKKVMYVTEKGNLTLPKKVHTKETNTKETNTKEKRNVHPSTVVEIFSFWKDEMNHPNSKLDSKRRGKIEARIKEGRTLEECKKAIVNCKDSPFHMGQNDRAMVYDDIELIFRDATKFEMFLNLSDRKDPYDGFENFTGRQDGQEN